MNNRLFQKIMVFILLFVMTAGYLPPLEVLASTQPPAQQVGIIRESATSTPGSPSQTVRTRITWSGDISQYAVTPNAQDQITANMSAYDFEGFHVEAQNMSTGATTALQNANNLQPTVNAWGGDFAGVYGSIYRFQVRPYHMHVVSTVPLILERKYPDASPNYDSALYMTDIKVEAVGEGNELTVTWDHPTFSGQPVFNRYRINYNVGSVDPRVGGKTRTFSVGGEGGAVVAAPDPARPGVSRLKATIEDDELVPGYYSVSVEPLLDGDILLRGSASGNLPVKVITIGNKIYNIEYSPFSTMYGVSDATVTLALELEDYTATQIMLRWRPLTNLGTVSKVEVFSHTDKDQLQAILDTQQDVPGADVVIYDSTTSAPLAKPTQGIMYYGIRVHVQGKQILASNIVEYDPSKLNIKPLRPDIHIPITATGDSSGLVLYWDAFVRSPFNDGDVLKEVNHPVTGNRYTVDTDVYYDIWVSSSLGDLFVETLNPTSTFSPGSLVGPEFHERVPDGELFPAWTTVMTQYYENQSLTNLVRNKNYYIKIVARRKAAVSSGASDGFISSDPAYGEIYISPSGEISTPPMISKPPLRIRQHKGSDVITENSVDVQWAEQWYEVYGEWDDNGTTREAWHTVAAIHEGTLLFGPDAEKYPDKIIDVWDLKSEEAIVAALTVGGTPFSSARIRRQTLAGCGYEYKFMTQEDFFAAVNSASTLVAYFTKLRDETTADGWREFTPLTTDEDGSVVDPYVTINGLAPNTPYTLFIRPYRVVSGGKKITYPNYIFGTTTTGQGPIDFIPTVPRFEAISSTDTTVDVRWTHTEPAGYEIVYSTVPYTDIGANLGNVMRLSRTDLDAARVETTDGEQWKYYTIEGLFPETTYYFWIRAIGSVNGEDKYSEWSNPVSMATTELQTPKAPDGLGLISDYHISVFNQANSQQYKKTAAEYIIVEWNKDVRDESGPATTGMSGANEIIGHPDFLTTYAVKFNGLVANRQHYVRAKTILVASMAGPGSPTIKQYYYLVQISDGPDFENYSEVLVPGTPPAEGSMQYLIIKESPWSSTVILNTGTSDDEYDSEFDPNLVPLPELDFEIIYDGRTRTLTYRFRADGKDEDGNYDNRVDQRLISSLQRKQQFAYNVDVSSYENRIVERRVVEIPYTVMQAFEEYKVSLGIRADNMTLTVPPGAIQDTFAVKGASDYGDASRVRFTIVEDLPDLPRLQVVGTEYVQQYVSKPQQVSVSLTTPTTTTAITTLGKPMDVKLNLDSRYGTLDKNVTVVRTDPNSGGWDTVSKQYERSGGRLSTEGQPGTYAAVATNPPKTIVSNPSDVSMYNVTSNISFNDMSGFYNSNADVTANQFINLVHALLNNKSAVNLNEVPSPDTVLQMQRAGAAPTVAGSAIVPREQAIKGLISVFENKAYRITPVTDTIASSPYKDIASAAADCQQALLKAGQIDFLGNTTQARPKQNLKLGELLQMVDIIIMDAGY